VGSGLNHVRKGGETDDRLTTSQTTSRDKGPTRHSGVRKDGGCQQITLCLPAVVDCHWPKQGRRDGATVQTGSGWASWEIKRKSSLGRDLARRTL